MRAFGKKGEILQRKALKKSKKRENLQHTLTHSAVFLAHAHSYHAKEPTEEESETKRNLNDAPRPLFLPLSLARLRWTSVRRSSVVVP